MLKTIPRFVLLAVLLIGILACNLPSTAPNAAPINTAVAKTFVALTPTSIYGPGIPVTGNDSPTPSPTMATPVTMTALVLNVQHTITPVTPSATLDVTATFPITPGVVQVRVSAPTNCRGGPSLAYERVATFTEEEVAQVIGRNERGNYWLIQNPDSIGQTCWIWGKYATLTGDTAIIPVFTPPPLPISAFGVTYHGLESCEGIGWWVDLELKNTGRLTFRSNTLSVRDRDTSVDLSHFEDGFTDRFGCLAGTSEELPPGEARIISSPVFSYNPAGHSLRAVITLCSETRQTGTCISQTLYLTP